MFNSEQAARELRRALQLFVETLSDETRMMEVASVYPEWQPDQSYAVGTIVKWGVNSDGETQLYQVQQAHISQADWTPEVTPALFKKVGFTESGTPIWTQPLGAHDAYQAGDRVEHKGVSWVSAIDGNVWEPGVHGWEERHV